MCLTEIKPTKVILSQFQREQHLRNPLIFERARFRRFSALRPDTERTNRPTRAVISRQRPSKIKNLTELIPYRGYASALGSTPGCKTPVTKNEGTAESRTDKSALSFRKVYHLRRCIAIATRDPILESRDNTRTHSQNERI